MIRTDSTGTEMASPANPLPNAAQAAAPAMPHSALSRQSGAGQAFGEHEEKIAKLNQRERE
jgi:hypothetical protein